jgi:DNA polymerase III subunit gamma/tau
MSETALYRKYRPKSFTEVRDQEHIVTVLEGAIKKDTIPHAILFSGTRGTGKTTLARIFAGAIGTAEHDLYEIDAASNRGIDDIRELKEAVHTLPYESKYKVYIVDEVHMLTKEAFNALLKTLEEPPSHVVFILATTEEDKLLDTILSRCQVFRFNTPSRRAITDLAIDVSKKEGFVMSPEAADLVALAADGSFRDALGIVQKVILASGDTIGEADEVATIIGAPRTQSLLVIVKALHGKDKETALSTLAEIVAESVDVKLFSRLLLEHIRAIILLRNIPSRSEAILAAFGPEARSLISECADTPGALNSHTLLKLLPTVEQISRSPIPSLPLEIAFIDITEA